MLDLPKAKADPRHWSVAPVWRPEEIPALSLGLDPRWASKDIVERLDTAERFREYEVRRDLLDREIEAARISKPIHPWVVVNWGDRIGHPFAEPLRQLILDRGPPAGRSDASLGGEDLEPRERSSLHKMLYAALHDKFGLESEADIPSVVARLESASTKAGIPIDQKTLRKHVIASIGGVRRITGNRK